MLLCVFLRIVVFTSALLTNIKREKQIFSINFVS